jgi:hypothetical protein
MDWAIEIPEIARSAGSMALPNAAGAFMERPARFRRTSP